MNGKKLQGKKCGELGYDRTHNLRRAYPRIFAVIFLSAIFCQPVRDGRRRNDKMWATFSTGKHTRSTRCRILFLRQTNRTHHGLAKFGRRIKPLGEPIERP